MKSITQDIKYYQAILSYVSFSFPFSGSTDKFSRTNPAYFIFPSDSLDFPYEAGASYCTRPASKR